MSRFTTTDLMVAVLAEDFTARHFAGPASCNPGGKCCTNPSTKKRASRSGAQDLALLRDQLRVARS